MKDGKLNEASLLFSPRRKEKREAKKAYKGYLRDGGEPFVFMDRPAARTPRP